MKQYEDAIHDLWHDFLDLAESYSDSLPHYEFGFALIRFASRMLFDVAPSQEVAKKTIQAAVESGQEWSLEERENK